MPALWRVRYIRNRWFAIRWYVEQRQQGDRVCGLLIDAMRSPRSLSVALVAVLDNWASEPTLVEIVGSQLLRAARVYASARGIEVFVAPVPQW